MVVFFFNLLAWDFDLFRQNRILRNNYVTRFFIFLEPFRPRLALKLAKSAN
jgi:hypothetical protein